MPFILYMYSYAPLTHVTPNPSLPARSVPGWGKFVQTTPAPEAHPNAPRMDAKKVGHPRCVTLIRGGFDWHEQRMRSHWGRVAPSSINRHGHGHRHGHGQRESEDCLQQHLCGPVPQRKLSKAA